MNIEFTDRLMSNTKMLDNGCWDWQGKVVLNGYVDIRKNGERSYLHRFSYRMFKGPIPDGLGIDHLCHNADLSCRGGRTCRHRRCWNPEHLEPATVLENTRRGRVSVVNGQNSRDKTHCPSGHAYDEMNTLRWRNRRICRSCLTARNRQYSQARKARASDVG